MKQITMAKLAAEYGYNVTEMSDMLVAFKIIRKHGTHGAKWEVTHKFADKGYTDTTTDGEKSETVWTPKGHDFIYDQLKRRDCHTLEEIMNDVAPFTLF